jgi:pyruvate formate lyase activating enzyme
VEQRQAGGVRTAEGVWFLKVKIGGFQKVSLIDCPGKISSIVFTQGCNFRCPYCHNPELVDPGRYGELIAEDEILAFLEKRRGKIDAVTVTGGEPMLQHDLGRFLETVSGMDYFIKVDTNGSCPDVLENLIRLKLVDYWAMDVKGPFKKYRQITASKVETEKILRSIELIRSSQSRYEFRTTVVRSQLNHRDLISTARVLNKPDLYVLQPFNARKTLEKRFLSEKSYSPEEFSKIRGALQKICTRVDVRSNS